MDILIVIFAGGLGTALGSPLSLFISYLIWRKTWEQKGLTFLLIFTSFFILEIIFSYMIAPSTNGTSPHPFLYYLPLSIGASFWYFILFEVIHLIRCKMKGR